MKTTKQLFDLLMLNNSILNDSKDEEYDPIIIDTIAANLDIFDRIKLHITYSYDISPDGKEKGIFVYYGNTYIFYVRSDNTRYTTYKKVLTSKGKK